MKERLELESNLRRAVEVAEQRFKHSSCVAATAVGEIGDGGRAARIDRPVAIAVHFDERHYEHALQ